MAEKNKSSSCISILCCCFTGNDGPKKRTRKSPKLDEDENENVMYINEMQSQFMYINPENEEEEDDEEGKVSGQSSKSFRKSQKSNKKNKNSKSRLQGRLISQGTPTRTTLNQRAARMRNLNMSIKMKPIQNLNDNTSKDQSIIKRKPKKERSTIRAKREKEMSMNSISLAKNRVIFDNKNGFRTSNLVFSSVIAPGEEDEINEYDKEKFEPHKYYQEVDSSAAIMRNRKTREVYYKNRKRKVDQDRESNDHQRNFIEDEDDSEYADPQPQEPKEYNNFISSPANDSVSTSNANMVNAVKENFITNEHSNQSSFLRNDKMSKQSIQDASMAKGTINETLNEAKLAPRKIPSKKQSSDKRRRIVNTRQNLITGSSENADRKSTHPMVSSPPLNPQKRPLSKTGLITDLHMPPQNAAIIGMKLVEKPSNDRDPTSILPTRSHPDTISNLYIKAVTQNAAGGQRQEVDLDRQERKEENSEQL
ncbi:unnamed protein product [Moneuplotes crassus]|uniref:Uncharacterized protein n=1 Tax=Euplotes crassus TaxID=5936 RepID=A0AAD1XFS2_EUPCR|nr:unnamed protein product [Moneuplotes crassus]